jgi:hypothetical protein
VDHGHNVGIAFFPHIQCASLNCHVGITFISSINSEICLTIMWVLHLDYL